jgi:hypothetical protein
MLRNYLAQSIAAVPVGLAATGTAGFIGSGGRFEGVPAGMLGSIGGGMRGAFSGGVLGALAGAGVGLAAIYHKGTRQRIAKSLGNLLTSPAAFDIAEKAAASPIASMPHMGGLKTLADWPSAMRLKSIATQGTNLYQTPQQMAMHSLIGFLEQKRVAKTLQFAAAMGGGAGVIAGVPLGGLRKAYQAGQAERLPA